CLVGRGGLLRLCSSDFLLRLLGEGGSFNLGGSFRRAFGFGGGRGYSLVGRPLAARGATRAAALGRRSLLRLGGGLCRLRGSRIGRLSGHVLSRGFRLDGGRGGFLLVFRFVELGHHLGAGRRS